MNMEMILTQMLRYCINKEEEEPADNFSSPKNISTKELELKKVYLSGGNERRLQMSDDFTTKTQEQTTT